MNHFMSIPRTTCNSGLPSSPVVVLCDVVLCSWFSSTWYDWLYSRLQGGGAGAAGEVYSSMAHILKPGFPPNVWVLVYMALTPEASSRYRAPASARPMPSSHKVTATISGYFGCTNWPPKMARYGRGDLVWIRH